MSMCLTTCGAVRPHLRPRVTRRRAPRSAQLLDLREITWFPDAAVILYRPLDEDELPDWVSPMEPHSARHFGPDEDHIEVMLADWKMIVETATGMTVEIL